MNNVFGKNMAYLKKLDSELIAVKSLYPAMRHRDPHTKKSQVFGRQHILSAIAFYRNSFSAGDIHMEIGRLSDTAKVKDNGHVQSLDFGHWTPVANDCWMLGGFHSSKTFRLHTMSYDSVWDASRPGTSYAGHAFPVTRREITGLLEFGFRPINKNANWITFESKTPSAVMNATLAQYAAITTLEKRNSKMVHDFIGNWLGG